MNSSVHPSKNRCTRKNYGYDNYGLAKRDDAVYIELKKKFKGIVYKRRVQLALKEAQDYLILGKSPSLTSQILQEIDWFLKGTILYRRSILPMTGSPFWPGR
jgi:hypothetical protein